jgi:hypothetical protein
MQIPQTKLEEITISSGSSILWFLYFSTGSSISPCRSITVNNTSEIKKEIIERFRELKQAEDMGGILETQM